MTPGHSYAYLTDKGLGFGTWGLDNGRVYNLRTEGVYSQYERGAINVDSFEDGRGEFGLEGITTLPVVFNKKGEFALLTRDSDGPIKEVHSRMPVIVKGPYSWIKAGYLDQIDYYKLQRL